MGSEQRAGGHVVRERLDHPIIDADGHTVEFMPALAAYLKDAGLAGNTTSMLTGVLGPAVGSWAALDPSERARRRAVRPPWWGVPTKNTRDNATAMLPGLLYERLDEIGIDFAVIYPTIGLVMAHIANDEVRQAACRAVNRYHADIFAPYRDRLCPVAVIPMHSPQEAIAELTAARDMGLRAAMIAGYVRRPIEAVSDRDPDVAAYATWVDTFGLDSAHDYDPLWAKCVELGVSITAHSPSMGWDGRASISSYMFNHIGHFATASEALCKSLFMGGVTRRFPELRVGLLEGGVNWACSLFSDLLGHWEKRNGAALGNYDPSQLDRAEWARLFDRYGGEVARIAGAAAVGREDNGFSSSGDAAIDEFAPAGIARREDIRDRFLPNFFFGCEADDPMTPHAFDTRLNPFGVRLNAMFSSDIGHWDVPNMSDVLHEAFEPVEHGQLDLADFRDFTFGNVARFYTDTNPTFFDGTVIAAHLSGASGGVGLTGSVTGGT